MRRELLGGVVAGVVTIGLLCPVGAWAGAGAGPGFAVEADSTPTVFSADHNGSVVPDSYILTVTNSGSAATDGSPIVITDTLPVALTAIGIEGDLQSSQGVLLLSCASATVTCTYNGQLLPGDSLRVLVTIDVTPGATGMTTNTVSVSGGGAAAASAGVSNEIGSGPESLAAPFGPVNFTDRITNPEGAPDVQAGDHPYETTVSWTMNSTPNAAQQEYPVAGGFGGNEGTAKDFVVELPPGFVGNPDAIEKCPQYKVPTGECPATTQIGVAKVYRQQVAGQRFLHTEIEPIYNVVPDNGFPAEFAFRVAGIAVPLYATVNAETGYAVRVISSDIPPVGRVHGVSVTFFGTPLTDPNYLNANPSVHSGATPLAFLENPTSCTTEPQNARLWADSWQQPGSMRSGVLPFGSPDLGDPAEPNWKMAETTVFPQITGCNLLQFNPGLEVTPDTTQADQPSGVTVDLKVPQAPLQTKLLGTPAFRDVTVTLPSGMALSPSAANGLEACSDAQFALSSPAAGSCPAASEIGVAKITTPLLGEPLQGQVFLGSPECDPCTNVDASDGKMLRIFLQVTGSGVVVKQEGQVYANSATGQLTTRFVNTPQLPVSDVQLKFKSGATAALAMPQECGAFTTTSDLTPWSEPVTPDATPFSPFNVDWDGDGGACPTGMPLAPSFSAGTSNPNAGQLSPLTVTLDREDREQDLSGIQVRTPPGLLGSISSVPLCGEPQASLGTCSAASRIGSMTVAAGPGSRPFYERGSLYLTGPYRGAPFGLSIVVPTVAGPFNLGNVVVRAQVNVDVHTAALTVTSDPLPQILDGIPLRLRIANVTVDRPGFIFNPTNCAQQAITATIAGSQGAETRESSPFAVAGCAGLHFGPKFTVSSAGHTSKADGASLDARLVYPAGPQSNIAKVKVDLPKQLPSRLTTLQKACTAATFEANPAACPAASLIGAVKAVTPILPVALTGPVYFVSHGGEAFPSLIAVLQGDGVRVDLVGTTHISKAGITSSTFANVPDVPVSSFELYLPEGPHSALAANGNLCTSKPVLPTSFIAQDGAQLKQSTKLTVTGCPKVKAKKAGKKQRAQKAKRANDAARVRTGEAGGRS